LGNLIGANPSGRVCPAPVLILRPIDDIAVFETYSCEATTDLNWVLSFTPYPEEVGEPTRAAETRRELAASVTMQTTKANGRRVGEDWEFFILASR